jgi:ubiquinone/menaquinone biosynthesis C-methylase UbiE
MSADSNPVISGYSDLAAAYDTPGNLQSCWGRSSDEVLGAMELDDTYRSVADIGCGTGHALLALAERGRGDTEFVGVEPAAQMRERAAARTKHLANVRILDGTFERIPLPSASVDYLYSIYAFHWTTEPERGAEEIRRVLGPAGEMDVVFVGPGNGVEFNKVTTPIVRRYMGRAYMVATARMQRQISRDGAVQLFERCFPAARLTVDESHQTHYDTLDGHWAWRVRIEGHFSKIPAEKRADFDAEVREALEGLGTDRGIPYTIHRLHVKLRR